MTSQAQLPHPGDVSSGPSDTQRFSQGVLLVVILAAAWLLRARELSGVTAFMDEALNVAYGRLYLSNPSLPPYHITLYANYGWFLWPVLTAIADAIGGLWAVRELTIFFGVLTVYAVYGLGKHFFSTEVGLGSALVYALLGPALITSRIATYDAMAMSLLALGAWTYARAWREQRRELWLGAAALLFGAFLAKYVVAIYFPFLVLLGLRKGRQAFLFFILPLAGLCLAYGVALFDVLQHVLHTMAVEDRGFTTTPKLILSTYVLKRLDLWVLMALSPLSLLKVADPMDPRTGRPGPLRIAALLWGGTLVMFLLRLTSPASDTRFFKHVAYSMIFLTPLAVEGLFRLARRVPRRGNLPPFAAGALVLAVLLGWAGGSFDTRRLSFWSNLEPVAAFFDGRLLAKHKMLVNDLGILYYVSPPLPYQAVVGPYEIRHSGRTGAAGYVKAVLDGRFDYIVFVGRGSEESVQQLQHTVRPVLPERYRLRLRAVDPHLLQPIEIFERIDPPPDQPQAQGIEILSPVSGTAARPVKGTQVRLEGRVWGAQPGWQVEVDVFTDKWYPQGNRITLADSNTDFMYPIYLGSPCNLTVRVRLFDGENKQMASDTVSVNRAEPDGTSPQCL